MGHTALQNASEQPNLPIRAVSAVRVLAQVSGETPPGSQPASPRVADGPRVPGDQWKTLFESGKIQPETIRRLVTELSAARKSEDVISLLERAIIEGHGQPWMYEVLALTMEIAGRPRAQIERVLLSSRDVTPPTTESLLFLAAYLARFQRYEQAIRCCRQAAELEPSRPDAYASALRYAIRTKDLPTQAWGTLGVLTYAWGPDQRGLRDEARAAVADIRVGFRQAGQWLELAAFERSVAAADRVDLRIRVEWVGAGDLDLEVTEPHGSVCHVDQRYSAGGGILLHDGNGPVAANCYDEYACPIAWSGEYRVKIVHSWGNIVGKRANLIVTRGISDTEVERDEFPVAVTAEGTQVRILLRNGRRQQAAAPKPVSRNSPLPQPAKPSILAQLAPGNQPGLGQGFNPGVGGGVGYQPVVAFFNEGVAMSALATVSGDRRYVRLQMAPAFTNITDVFTFSFQQ